MYVRLAFAVAAHLEPEILIVDEVLAVGDAKFQQKCITKMEEVSQEGRTILFVSHRTASIQALCNRAIWLEEGCLRLDGDSETVVNEYLSSLLTDSGGVATSGCGRLEIERVTLKTPSGDTSNLFPSGGSLTIEVHYHARKPILRPHLWLGITGKSGFLFAGQMNLDGFCPERLEGRGIMSCTFEQLPLLPRQRFIVQLACEEQDARTSLIKKTDVAHFFTTGSAASLGFFGHHAERVAESASAAVIVPYTWHLPDGRSRTVDPFTVAGRCNQTE
jgi:lipopolysaccharide transport system ATP-binding protein